MKEKFPGYFSPTAEEIKNIWDTAIFSLDANVLLNLYRYSGETRDEFIKILEKIKKRAWVPNYAVKEFFQNRLDVIESQEKTYEMAIKSIEEIENEFKNPRRHPFIDEELLNKFIKLSYSIKEELKKNQKDHEEQVYNDEIIKKIESIFSGNVGEEYDNDLIKEVLEEGEERFQKKIPPGYKDSNKSEDSKDIRQYGDLIIWKQIMDKSKSDKKGVILVTDDRKEDWWLRFKGKTLQPRPELIEEFKKSTNQDFYMYQSDKFLEFAREYLNEDVNQNAIDEIKEMRKLDENERHEHIKLRRKIMKLERIKGDLKKKNLKIDDELSYLRSRMDSMEKFYFDKIYDDKELDGSKRSSFDLNNLKNAMHNYSIKEDDMKVRIEKNKNVLENIEFELEFLKKRLYYR